jgi:hypothetical protein
MNIEYFRIGFEKTGSAVKNLLNATLKNLKKKTTVPKAVTKAPSANYNSYLKTKKTLPETKTLPRFSSDTLDYRQLKSEMKEKNIASRSRAKRKLSNIEGKPVLTGRSSRYNWDE